MTQMRAYRTLISLSVALGLAAVAIPAAAGSHGNGSAGSGMSFRALQQFRFEADAKKHCGSDAVVWGSSENRGKFYADGVGPQRIGGFYACMAEARSAGYQIVTGD